MTTVHGRQTSRDVNVDFLDNKLAGFIPADFFLWHTRVHFAMPPRSRDLAMFENSVATGVRRNIYIGCKSMDRRSAGFKPAGNEMNILFSNQQVTDQ